MVRVRYAPSPTGTLHIGGARTALFNFLFARHGGGHFVLRVEDTDQARQQDGSEEAMMRGLKSLGIQWDEGPDADGDFGPYRQSDRLLRHQELAQELLGTGQAYRCFCTPEQLEKDREALRAQGEPPRYVGRCRSLTVEASNARVTERHVVRLKVPAQGTTVVGDLIRGQVIFENKVLDDFVIMKPDHTPVYNFAVVVDDHDMAITHVIRGEEHLSNTPKQILVYQALGFEVPAFAHLPMILAPDRSKLSKRHGATSVEEYRDQGILPEALVNYLLLLGWSAPSGVEMMSLEQAAEEFELSRVQHTAAIYDQKKLEWMNHQYFMHLPVERLVEAVRPFVAYAVAPGPSLEEAVALTRERSFTLVSLADSMRFLYHPPTTFDTKGVAKHFSEPAVPARLRRLAEQLRTISSWTHDAILACYDQLADEFGLKRAALIHPTRLAVTGKTVGPGLFELVELTGQDETVRRLEHVAKLIEQGEVTADPGAPAVS